MATWNAISWSALALLGFLGTSIVYRTIGPASYGVWATIASLRVFTMVLDGGLTLSIARDAALASTGAAGLRARFGASAALTLSIGALVVAAGFLFSWLPAAILGLSGEAASEASVVMMVVGCDAGVAIAASIWFATARGLERFDVLAAAGMLQVAVAVPLLILLTNGFGLIGAAVAFVIARLSSVTLVLAWLLGRRRYVPGLRIGRRALREVVTFVWPLWVVSAGTLIGLGTDVLIVGAFFGSVPAGAYALGAVVPAAAVGLLYALLDAAYPRLASSRGRDQALVLILMRMGTMLAGLGFGVMIAIAPDILSVWVGVVDPLAVPVMRIYAIVWILNVPAHILALQSITASKHRVLAPLVIGEALVSLAISVGLAAAGLPLGPAIGTLITLAVSNLVLVPWFLTRDQASARGRLAVTAATGLLIGGVAAAGIAAVLAGTDTEGLATLALATALVFLVTVLYVQTIRAWWRVLGNGGLAVRWRQRREVTEARAVIELARQTTPSLWIQSGPPLVSVRIATYNRGELVRDRAIASALAQTHQHLDVVVVGDHCDARTEAAVRSVGDRRVRFENLAERGRYPVNAYHRWMVAGSTPMNRGVDLARGTWIAPLDDDDEFTPDHVEALLDACRSRDLEFAYGIAAWEMSPGHWEPTGSWPLRIGQIVHSAVLYSTRLRMIKHDIESWRLEEPGDWNVWHRMRDAGARMGFVDQVVARHYLETLEREAYGSA